MEENVCEEEVEKVMELLRNDSSPERLEGVPPSAASFRRIVEGDVAKRSTTDVLWTALGYCHEAFSVILSVVDVVSDFVVAYEFYRDGQIYWCKAILAEILLANIVYTVVSVEGVVRGRHVRDYAWNSALGTKIGRFTQSSRLVQYPVMFVFGQFMPVLNWLSFLATQQRTAAMPQKAALERAAEGDISAAAAEELLAASESGAVWGRFSSAWSDHIRRHMGFHLEAVCEALPQCALQLLAATSVGRITPLQLASIFLSLISIVSKAYLFAQSFNIKAFIFKFLGAAFDVLSFFYLFATVMEPAEQTSAVWASPLELPFVATVLPDIVVSPLTRVVVMKMFTVFCLLHWLGVAFVVFGTLDDYVNGYLRRDSINIIAPLFIGVYVLLVPATIAVEVLKVSFVTLALAALQGSVRLFPASGALYDFLTGNHTRPGFDEADRRLRFVMRAMVRNAQGRSTSRFDRASLARYFDRVRVAVEITRSREAERKKNDDGASLPPSAPNTLNCFLGTELTRQLFMSREEFALVCASALLHYDNVVHSIREKRSSGKNIVVPYMVGASVFLAGCAVVSALISGPYVFLHALWVGLDNLNSVQALCLAGCALCVVCAAPLYPAMMRYITHNLIFDPWRRLNMMPKLESTSDAGPKLVRLIHEYYKPPAGAVLCACVPPQLIPRDVLLLTGEFLDNADIVTKKLTARELEAFGGLRQESELIVDDPVPLKRE